MAKNGNKKILHIKRRFKLNVGMIIFFIIFVYIVFSVTSYLQRDRIKYFEVEEGSIVKEHSYTGLILREEQVVNAEKSGYLNYYVPNNRKTAKGATVYSIDETGNLESYLREHPELMTGLTDTDIAELRAALYNDTVTLTDVDFNRIYDVNASLSAMVMEYAGFNSLSALSDSLTELGISFSEFQAPASGLVSYSIDGFESMTPSEVTADMFDMTSYNNVITSSGSMVESGAPLYKLITSDVWSIVFPMDQEDIATFSDESRVTISFTDKDISTDASFSVIKGSDGENYGKLDFTRYMIQFASERFVEFEIVSNNVSGLKIPERSITSKDFFIIPVEYLVENDDGTSGFNKEVLSDDGTAVQFVDTEIYSQDEEYCYVDSSPDSEFKVGDYVQKPGSSDRYQIGPTKSVPGVYNINKGYTVFRRIEELERDNGYCIVKKNTPYGPSVYDHIVLDASMVDEGELIYQ